MYDDDNITSSIQKEVFQLVYYGRLTYTDILYEMGYTDRRYWLEMVDSILRSDDNKKNNRHSLSDPNVINQLAKFS